MSGAYFYNMSVKDALRPSVLRCCFLAPYVPLRAEGSGSVSATDIL